MDAETSTLRRWHRVRKSITEEGEAAEAREGSSEKWVELFDPGPYPDTLESTTTDSELGLWQHTETNLDLNGASKNGTFTGNRSKRGTKEERFPDKKQEWLVVDEEQSKGLALRAAINEIAAKREGNLCLRFIENITLLIAFVDFPVLDFVFVLMVSGKERQRWGVTVQVGWWGIVLGYIFFFVYVHVIFVSTLLGLKPKFSLWTLVPTFGIRT